MQICESGMQISKISAMTYFRAFEKWDSQIFRGFKNFFHNLWVAYLNKIFGCQLGYQYQYQTFLFLFFGCWLCDFLKFKIYFVCIYF